ncbi:MAG: serine protease, partial [Pseudomonadota bacterium]
MSTHNYFYRLVLVAAAAFLFSACSILQAQTGEYSELFETLKPGLYIIESVERVSNNKNSVGSGFAVSTDGLMATNYHVVANAVLNPDQYSLRYKTDENEEGQLEVVAVDVLYDLALVRAVSDEPVLPMAFELSDELPAEGDTVLALGNPFDIGISIVPGTHNGLLERQFRQNIHFTGALNPGMSGGPAVNTDGQVIGINVAGAGNSVSFLVPVERLAALLEDMPNSALTLEMQREQIVERIRAHQDELIDDLLAGDWALEPFGPLKIPREVQPYINCTGNAMDLGSDTPWQQSMSNCTMKDRIYLSRQLDTGPLEILFA